MSSRFDVESRLCTHTVMRLLNLLAQRGKEITGIVLKSGNHQCSILIDVADISFDDAQIVAAKMQSIIGVSNVNLTVVER